MKSFCYIAVIFFCWFGVEFVQAKIDIDVQIQSRVFEDRAGFDQDYHSAIFGLEYSRALGSQGEVKIDVEYRQGKYRYVNPSSLYYNYISDNWEIKVGFDTVFWGVMELNHVVDIVNQSDYLSGFHGEKKLGQPMVAHSWIFDEGVFNEGILETYLLLGSVHREFLEEDDRLSGGVEVDESLAVYESRREDRRIDAAVRWSQTLNVFDYSLSYFEGNTRQPVLSFVPNAGQFVPLYDVVHRYALEAQVTLDHIILKAEAVKQQSELNPYRAWSSGFEYTQGGLWGSRFDVGYLLEYSHDNRSSESSVFQNDVFAGIRLTHNNTQASEWIVGISQDLDSGGKIIRTQFESRITEKWFLEIDSWIFTRTDSRDALFSIKDDSYIELAFTYYF